MTDTIERSDLCALRMLSGRNVRYGTKHKAMTRLRLLGLAKPHATGHGPPGDWTWTITAAGRAALVAMEACHGTIRPID